jgi:hypothetical protein
MVSRDFHRVAALLQLFAIAGIDLYFSDVLNSPKSWREVSEVWMSCPLYILSLENRSEKSNMKINKKFFTLAALLMLGSVLLGGCHQATSNNNQPAMEAVTVEKPKERPAGWHDGPMVRGGVWAMARTDVIVTGRQARQAMNVYGCNPQFRGATVTVEDKEIEIAERHEFPVDGKYDCKKFVFTDVGFTTLAHLDGGFTVKVTKDGNTKVFTGAPSKWQVHSIYLYYERGQMKAFANGPDEYLK